MKLLRSIVLVACISTAASFSMPPAGSAYVISGRHLRNSVQKSVVRPFNKTVARPIKHTFTRSRNK